MSPTAQDEGEAAAPAAAEALPPEATTGEGGEGMEDGEAAAEALPPEATTGEGGEGMEDGEAALKRMLDQAPPWPFQSVYPPPNCLGGFKVVDGRVSIPRYACFILFGLLYLVSFIYIRSLLPGLFFLHRSLFFT
jgi:hypothetical protein